MKYHNKLLIPFIVLCMVLVTACKKQSYYQVNPNSPSTTTPALSFTDIEINIFDNFTLESSYADRHLAYYEFLNSFVQYSWTRSDPGAASYNYGNYDVLRQVNDMDAAAAKSGAVTYQALAKFFRAVLFAQMTETYGDIPYSQALQAQTGLYKPVYDTQKSIYVGILADLEQANDMLDPASGAIQGDIIYNNSGNDVLEWKQLINAYKLRLLIHLSKKTTDPDLNVIQQFNTIINNPTKYPLMSSDEDNGQIVFNVSNISNYNPNYLSNDLQSGVSMEQGFVTMLQNLKDPRLFSFAAPVGGKPAGVFSNYAGVNAGLSVSDMQNDGNNASRINSRYYTSQTNEPYIFFSYAEQEFLIAEAISRGWVTGSAATHYNNAITASMNFYGISGSDVSTYLAQPAVVYNPTNALSQIITQKYISFFMNSGWEAFFEQRRTGIPTFDIGPGTLNNGIPKRWMYPDRELTDNSANLTAAIQRQFNGVDDINATMWLLQ